MNVNARKTAAAALSVLSNAILIVLKVIVGLLIGSVSVISEAAHSGVDLVASVVALVAVRGSGKPADARHPFGHGKLENISAAVEAALIFVAAGWIVWEAVHKMAHLSEIESPNWGVVVMFVSVAANMLVSGLLFKVGRQTESAALQADAWHLRTDVWTSAGVMIAMGLIWLGNVLLPNHGHWLHLIDPLAAIVVAAMIVKAAWHLTVQSAEDLMDAALPADEQQWIAAALAEFVPSIHGFHSLRSRRSGSVRFIDFHIFVDGRMTVADSHRLAHQCGERIKQHLEGASVMVHVEPCVGQCNGRCRPGCLLPVEQRQAIADANAAVSPDDDSGHA
jgi:cation diffusion facilitator family transporter